MNHSKFACVRRLRPDDVLFAAALVLPLVFAGQRYLEERPRAIAAIVHQALPAASIDGTARRITDAPVARVAGASDRTPVRCLQRC